MAGEGCDGTIQAEKLSVTPLAYAKAIIGAVLMLGVFFGGRSCGTSAGERARLRLEAKIEHQKAELNNAAAALNAASSKFREISHATEDSRAQAERVKAAASEATREAERQRDDLAEKLAEIERDAKREEKTCADVKLRVCGSPLR